MATENEGSLGAAAEISSMKDDIIDALNNNGNGQQPLTGSLDGIHEIQKPLQEINDHASSIASDVGEKGWFHDMLSQLSSWTTSSTDSDNEAKDLQQSMLDSLSEMTMFNETQDKMNLTEKKKKPKVNKGDAKIDDLKELPFALGTLGSVLVNTISKKDDKKGGKSISGFFKGLLEGVSGIASLAVALVAFAGATLLFNLVDWGSAVKGLVAFTLFTIGMVGISKIIGKNVAQFIGLAFGAVLLSTALGIFGISLWISANLLVPGRHVTTIFGKDFAFSGAPIGGVIASLVSFGVFLLGIVGISRLVKTNLSGFMQFAVGSLFIAAALAVFSAALWIASAIFSGEVIHIDALGISASINIPGALFALGTFTVFILGIAAVAVMTNKVESDLIGFAKASMLMAVSLVTFSLGLLVASKIFSEGINLFGFKIPKIDPVAAILALGTFMVFIIGTAFAAKLASSNNGNFMKFTIASILMSFSLVIFAGALAIASNMFLGGAGKIQVGDKEYNLPQVSIKGAVTALLSMAVFIGAFAVLGYLTQTVIVPIAQLTAVSILMSLSLITFALSLSLASNMFAGTSTDMTIGNKKFSLPAVDKDGALAALLYMGGFIVAYAALGAMFLIPIAGQAMLAGIALLATTTIAISLSLISFSKMLAVSAVAINGGNIEFDGKKYSLPKYDETTTEKFFIIFEKFLDSYKNMADNFVDKGGKSLSKVTKIINPIINSMSKMVSVVVEAAKNKDAILSLVSGNGNALDHLMDPVLYMLLGSNLDGNGGLMNVANQMDKQGAKVLKLVSTAISPLVESMNGMIDVVLKAANMKAAPFDSMEKMVAAANTNLNMIMSGPNGNDGFLNIFVITAEKTKGTSKKAKEAFEAMPPLVETLNGLVDIVAKAGAIPIANVNAGISGLSAVTTFLAQLMSTAKDLVPGGVNGFLGKMFTGDPVKQLEDVHKMLQPGGIYYSLIEDLCNIAGKFSGQGFENLSKVALVGTFTTDILAGSENFKQIMENISKGTESFKAPDKLNTIANAMERISVLDIAGKFDPIAELAEQSDKLASVAASMEKVADSFNKMSKASMTEKIGNAVSGIKNAFGFKKDTAEEMGEASGVNAASQSITITPGNELAGIAAILSKWDNNGVRVVGITPNGQPIEKVLNV